MLKHMGTYKNTSNDGNKKTGGYIDSWMKFAQQSY